MFADVQAKIRRKNAILFNRESACLRELLALMGGQSRLTLVLWALDCVREPLAVLQKRYPDEPAPAEAYGMSLAWAQGSVKMPQAKKAILRCHALAKTWEQPADIARCHAVGQACSVVHTGAHAPGLVFYELTALVIDCGYGYEQPVSDRIRYYGEKLRWWRDHTAEAAAAEEWADFLLRPGPENREQRRAARQ